MKTMKRTLKKVKPSDYFTKDQLLDLLIATCAGTLFLEKMDTLKHTPFYQQGTKNAGNIFISKLEQELHTAIKDGFNHSEDTMQIIIGSIEDIIVNGFKDLKPDELVLVAGVIKGVKEGQITLLDAENPENSVTIKK